MRVISYSWDILCFVVFIYNCIRVVRTFQNKIPGDFQVFQVIFSENPRLFFRGKRDDLVCLLGNISYTLYQILNKYFRPSEKSWINISYRLYQIVNKSTRMDPRDLFIIKQYVKTIIKYWGILTDLSLSWNVHISNIQKADFWTKNQQKWPHSAKQEFYQKCCLGHFIPFNTL